jgi:tetratricopeptide (TPR) repeat protein
MPRLAKSCTRRCTANPAPGVLPPSTLAREASDLQVGSGEVKGAKKSYESAFAAGDQSAHLASVAYSIESTKKSSDNAVSAYGRLSWLALLANKPPQDAAKYAEVAHDEDSSQAWIDVYRAHAYLFLGRYDDAKAIYLKLKDTPNSLDKKTTYADDIRADFDKLRKLGLSTPAFDRMAREIGIRRQ